VDTDLGSVPLLSRLLLLSPRRIATSLARVEQAGLVERTPNVWQLTLGVIRMWHRVLFRYDTIGTSPHSVRSSWRARLLAWRPLRFPFLLAERAIAPWDLTGLWSSRERLLRHVLGAHHDGLQLVYDLEILGCHAGALEELRDRARAIVERDDDRSRWLRDLTVFEGYHEEVLEAVEATLAGRSLVDDATAADPDVSFAAYLSWCARQPATPEATWRAWQLGRFTAAEGITPC
jgi:hypothetical protein